MIASKASLTAAFAFVAGHACADGLPRDLAQAAKAYDAAQIAGDRSALDRLLADDYLLVSSSGALESKAQFIGELTSPAYRLAPFVVEDPSLKLWPSGAVLGGVARLRGVDHGRKFDVRLRFADVWARREGHWRVVYTQAARAGGP